MKMTKDQLRRIIREAVERKLRALDEAPVEQLDMGELTDAVSGAMVTQMIERVDHVFSSNSFEMVAGTVDPDTVPLPGRYEDIEHWATKAVDSALADPELKDALLTVAIDVIHSLMEPA